MLGLSGKCARFFSAAILVVLCSIGASAEDSLDFSDFDQSKMIHGLYSGNFGHLALTLDLEKDTFGRDNRVNYIFYFYSAFREVATIQNGSCFDLYRPAANRALRSKVANFASSNEIEPFLLNLGNTMKRFADQIQDGRYDGALTEAKRTAAAQPDTMEAATVDLIRLLRNYSCSSDITKRVMLNVEAYAFGRPGILSPEEEERQVVEREKEAIRQEKARQLAMRDDARSSCSQQFGRTVQYDRDSLCNCIVASLDGGGLSDAEWDTLKVDFKQVTRISSGHGILKEQVGACLKN